MSARKNEWGEWEHPALPLVGVAHLVANIPMPPTPGRWEVVALYRVTPPMDVGHGRFTHLRVVGVLDQYGEQTLVLGADETGAMCSFGDIEGSFYGRIDHVRALRRAGYELQDGSWGVAPRTEERPRSRCGRRIPGHQADPLQLKLAFRSVGRPVRLEEVDDQRIVVVQDDGTRRALRAHDTTAALTALAGESEVDVKLYPHGVMTIGRTWLSVASDDTRWLPCDPAPTD